MSLVQFHLSSLLLLLLLLVTARLLFTDLSDVCACQWRLQSGIPDGAGGASFDRFVIPFDWFIISFDRFAIPTVVTV